MHSRWRRRSPLLALGVIALLLPAIAVACKKTEVMTADGCEALLSSAVTKLEKADVAAHADAKCAADSDCMESNSARCLVGCGGRGIPKTGSSAFASAVRAVDDNECKRWTENGCDALVPRAMPSCALYVPRCKDQACKMVPKDDRLTERECEELLATARNAVKLALSKADRTCTKDRDCTQTSGPSCVAGCAGPAVAVKGAPALSAALAQIDGESCRKWVSGRCPETTPQAIPSCPAYAARCTKGHCDNVMALAPR